MGHRILHIRSLTTGSVPLTSSLEIGELALNIPDGKVYMRRSGSIGDIITPIVTANTVTTGSIQVTNGFTGSLLGTSSWATNALTASFAPNYLLTSSFETWTGSNSSQFAGTSSRANFTRVSVLSGSLTSGSEDGNAYILPFYRPGTVTFGLTGSVYSTPIVSSTGILHYSASLDRLLTTASWAVNALTASYAENAPSSFPGGNSGEIQYNNSNTFGGVPALTYDGTTLTGTGSFSGSFSGNLRLGLFRGTQSAVPVVADKIEEVLVYSQYIPSGSFVDDDIMRIRWRIANSSTDTATYKIYIADTSDFSIVTGSSTYVAAICTASSAITYVQIKRDIHLNSVTSELEFFNRGNSSPTDDIITTDSLRTISIDYTADYWVFFSAIPKDTSHTCVSKYYTIERV